MSMLKLDFSNLKQVRGNPRIFMAPPIPLPLHTVNPRSIKGEEWWDTVRHKAYDYNEGCCWACGIHGERLEAHEIYEVDEDKFCMTLRAVTALCNKCHMFCHRGFVQTQVNKKLMTTKWQDEIVNHGVAVLKKHKLADMFIREFHIIWDDKEDMKDTWSKWYLHFDGKRHYSPFKNYTAWQNHWRDK